MVIRIKNKKGVNKYGKNNRNRLRYIKFGCCSAHRRQTDDNPKC